MPQLVLVSDDEGVQQLVRSVATNAGWTVLRAPQVTELLPHELDESTLLVLDLAAPCALDDLPVLRTQRPGMPVLSLADEGDPRSHDPGIGPILRLPCTITELSDALRSSAEPAVDLRGGADVLAS